MSDDYDEALVLQDVLAAERERLQKEEIEITQQMKSRLVVGHNGDFAILHVNSAGLSPARMGRLLSRWRAENQDLERRVYVAQTSPLYDSDDE